MRLLLLILLFFVFAPVTNGQTKTHKLYTLEKRLKDGDKAALFEIAPFFDSNKELIEYLGHHADDRANAWMKFLEDEHLLKQEHKQPISFRYMSER
jgi:hypothetical protein